MSLRQVFTDRGSYNYCLNKTFYHIFCNILNVFTIVFFECFGVCIFCESFFTFFTYSFHYNTIQNNTKEVSTNILRLLILCHKHKISKSKDKKNMP